MSRALLFINRITTLLFPLNELKLWLLMASGNRLPSIDRLTEWNWLTWKIRLKENYPLMKRCTHHCWRMIQLRARQFICKKWLNSNENGPCEVYSIAVSVNTPTTCNSSRESGHTAQNVEIVEGYIWTAFGIEHYSATKKY